MPFVRVAIFENIPEILYYLIKLCSFLSCYKIPWPWMLHIMMSMIFLVIAKFFLCFVFPFLTPVIEICQDSGLFLLYRNLISAQHFLLHMKCMCTKTWPSVKIIYIIHFFSRHLNIIYIYLYVYVFISSKPISVLLRKNG